MSGLRGRLSRPQLTGFETVCLVAVALAVAAGLGAFVRGEVIRNRVERIDICQSDVFRSREVCKQRLRVLAGLGTERQSEAARRALRGRRGPRGERGRPGVTRIIREHRVVRVPTLVTGPRGAQGVQGERGPRGPAGIGLPGPPGPPVTPEQFEEWMQEFLCSLGPQFCKTPKP